MMTNSATTALSNVYDLPIDKAELEFAALMRKIDRIDPSYRE